MPNILISISRTQMVKEKNQFLQVILWPTHTHIHKFNFKISFFKKTKLKSHSVKVSYFLNVNTENYVCVKTLLHSIKGVVKLLSINIELLPVNKLLICVLHYHVYVFKYFVNLSVAYSRLENSFWFLIYLNFIQGWFNFLKWKY